MSKGKLFAILIVILAIFAVSAVSAADNDTPSEVNAVIVVKDVTREYSEFADPILFEITDLDDNPIDDADPVVTYDKKTVDAYLDEDYDYSDNDGTYFIDVEPKVGTHKVKIELNTSDYLAKPVTFTVKITPVTTKVTLKPYVTTTKEYAVMRATVKDRHNHKITEGTVKFKVNGKTYTVKVKNGAATKKIRLKKAKTFTYTASFSAGKNYRASKASSKLYIKKTKNYYTLKIRKYTVKLPYRKYVRVLNAKNNGKLGYADVNTGIRRAPEIGGGYYCVGISTNDDYFTYYGYPMHDYIFLRATSYLEIKKINLYTANF